MDPVTLAAAIMTFAGSGVRAAEVLRRLTKQPALVEDLSKAKTALLALLERPEDPLTGRWDVLQWDYHRGGEKPGALTRAPYHVSGKLHVFLKDEARDLWRGFLLLDYVRFRRRANFLPRSLRIWWERRLGWSFTGGYGVEFRRGQDGGFTGSSKMIYRVPDLGARFAGRFKKLVLDDGGDLCGEFENTTPLPAPTPRGASTVRFHQRTRWRDVTTSELV